MDYGNNAKVAPPADTTPEQKQLQELLGEYMHAKVEFDSACHDAFRALGRREHAVEQLAKLTSLLQRTAESAQYDPTQPPPMSTGSSVPVSAWVSSGTLGPRS